MSIQELLPWLHFVVIPILIYIATTTKSIRDQIQLVNSRVSRLETWKDGHDKQDDSRHEDIQAAFDQVRKEAETRQERVHKLGDQLTTLITRVYINAHKGED